MRSLNSFADKPGFLSIGKVVGIHGVKGNLKILSYAESRDIFTAERSFLFLDSTGKENRYTIRWAKPHQKLMLINLKEIGTRTAAEETVGSRILIERSELPDLEEGTYYWTDIMGLAVFSADDDACLGWVESIIPTGGNDVYVIRHEAGEFLVPAIDDVVTEIDLENRRMTIRLIEGLTSQ